MLLATDLAQKSKNVRLQLQSDLVNWKLITIVLFVWCILRNDAFDG